MAATNSLAGAAANIITGQSDHAATLDGRLQTETATQTAIDNVISQASGVNLDTEFSHLLQLQQAYATNARIVSVTQNMFNALLVASGGTATG
jgi:flagellar hook-associated protein 1 FlgK